MYTFIFSPFLSPTLLSFLSLPLAPTFSIIRHLQSMQYLNLTVCYSVGLSLSLTHLNTHSSHSFTQPMWLSRNLFLTFLHTNERTSSSISLSRTLFFISFFLLLLSFSLRFLTALSLSLSPYLIFSNHLFLS